MTKTLEAVAAKLDRSIHRAGVTVISVAAVGLFLSVAFLLAEAPFAALATGAATAILFILAAQRADELRQRRRQLARALHRREAVIAAYKLAAIVRAAARPRGDERPRTTRED